MASRITSQGLFVALERRGKAAFVADGGVVALGFQHALEGVVDFGAHLQGFGKFGAPIGHDHEFLEIDVVVGVFAAVENVHHRHRQDVGVAAADIAVQRQVDGRGGGLGHGQRNAKNGVGAELWPCWRCRPARTGTCRALPEPVRPCRGLPGRFFR